VDELELRQRLAATAARAIPDGSHPTIDIMTAAARRRRRFRWSVRRLPLALGVAVIGVALATAGAVAMGGGTFPVQFNLINLSPAASAKLAAAGADASPTDDAATRAARAQKEQLAAQKQAASAGQPSDGQDQGADSKKALAASDGTSGDGGTKTKPTPAGTMTFAQVEAAFGGHVLVPTAAGAQLRDAGFQAADTQPMLGGTPAPTVSLQYDLDATATNRGSRVEITEQHNTSSAPLTVDALNQNGPQVKTTGGLGPASIETIDGGSYVVGRLPSDQSVEWVIWKSSDGLTITVHFLGGVSHDAAVAFVMGMA